MWLVAVAAGGGLLLSTLLKYGFARDRPHVVPRLAAALTPYILAGRER